MRLNGPRGKRTISGSTLSGQDGNSEEAVRWLVSLSFEYTTSEFKRNLTEGDQIMSPLFL